MLQLHSPEKNTLCTGEHEVLHINEQVTQGGEKIGQLNWAEYHFIECSCALCAIYNIKIL